MQGKGITGRDFDAARKFTGQSELAHTGGVGSIKTD